MLSATPLCCVFCHEVQGSPPPSSSIDTRVKHTFCFDQFRLCDLVTTHFFKTCLCFSRDRRCKLGPQQQLHQHSSTAPASPTAPSRSAATLQRGSVSPRTASKSQGSVLMRGVHEDLCPTSREIQRESSQKPNVSQNWADPEKKNKTRGGLYNVKAITCASFNLIFTWVSTRKPWMCAHSSGWLCPRKVAFSGQQGWRHPGQKAKRTKESPFVHVLCHAVLELFPAT